MICNHCSANFQNPVTVKEPLDDDFNGQRSFIGYDVCPECGSTDIEYQDRCICGEWKRKSEDYCINCLEIVAKITQCAITDILEFIPNINRSQARDLLRDYVEDNL